MADFFAKLVDFINATQIPTQLHEVDIHGLFTNGYFLAPFILLLGYMVFKRAINGMIMLGIGIGLWVFSGTPYVQQIYINGEVQMDKVLPVVAVAVIALGVMVYVFFIRSD